VPTGFHLVARMMGSVSYITRSEYADRAAMFAAQMARIRHSLPAGAKARSPRQINDIIMMMVLERIQDISFACHLPGMYS